MIEAALTLATINKLIIDYVFSGFKKKFPEYDFWWVMYVALVTGAGLGWLSQLNLFVDVMPDVVTGRVLTAVFVGGGSGLIHQLFSSFVDAVKSIAVKNRSMALPPEFEPMTPEQKQHIADALGELEWGKAVEN